MVRNRLYPGARGDNVSERALENEEAVRRVCKGNTDAIRFLEDITDILHLWDDLIDRDKPLTDGQINAVMWKALVDLPRNPFYAANFHTLNILLMAAIVNWEVATKMERERGGQDDLHIAYILRSSYIDLVLGVAVILGGREHAVEMMLPARRLWHNEGFEGFCQALELEMKVRGD
jgi:hypothetical protein